MFEVHAASIIYELNFCHPSWHHHIFHEKGKWRESSAFLTFQPYRWMSPSPHPDSYRKVNLEIHALIYGKISRKIFSLVYLNSGTEQARFPDKKSWHQPRAFPSSSHSLFMFLLPRKLVLEKYFSSPSHFMSLNVCVAMFVKWISFSLREVKKFFAFFSRVARERKILHTFGIQQLTSLVAVTLTLRAKFMVARRAVVVCFI